MCFTAAEALASRAVKLQAGGEQTAALWPRGGIYSKPLTKDIFKDAVSTFLRSCSGKKGHCAHEQMILRYQSD